jgi:hypothetical protein
MIQPKYTHDGIKKILKTKEHQLPGFQKRNDRELYGILLGDPHRGAAALT